MNHDYEPGIDTSAWQFNPDGKTGVDWTVAAAMGVRYNIVRIGRGGRTANACVNGVDRALEVNVRLSVDAGLKWAGYVYPDYMALDSPERQAQIHALAYETQLDLHPTSAPIVIDVEAGTDGSRLTGDSLRDWLGEYRQEVVRLGHEAIYANDSHWDPVVKMPGGGRDLIVPDYVPTADIVNLPKDASLWPGWVFGHKHGPGVSRYFPTWAAWQFTASAPGALLGAVPASPVTVDCQIMKRSVFERWFGS
jgi:hypothetical protein